MNKNFILTSLLLLSFLLSACGTTALAASPDQPISIEDALLLAAWGRLNDQTEPVQLWNGLSITGHDLAQFVLDHSIPILWTSPDISTKVAFSVLKCKGETCVYSSNQPGIPPIFVGESLNHADRLDDLVDTLAHEIYHRTQPYGQVIITMYEEYLAYYVGAYMSGMIWANFKGYDPLKQACLIKWFSDYNLLAGYQDHQTYPLTVLPSVDSSSNVCTMPSASSTAISSVNETTCLLNPDDSKNCPLATPTSTPGPETKLVCNTNLLGLIDCRTIIVETERP